jgi:hypothetical protein
MREKVAVATVDGKAYFLIVNQLKEKDIPFLSLVPSESVPNQIKVVITTPKEMFSVDHEKILVFSDKCELDFLVDEVKKILDGKEAYHRIVVGIDPGQAIGLVVLADGKVLEEGNCFSTQEVTNSITKAIRNVNLSVTAVSVKVGNGAPVYKEILEALDTALPPQAALEAVSEAGTNKPSKKHSRAVRHISSATRIAGRIGRKVPRRNRIAANC